jgi:hypothetical protein
MYPRGAARSLLGGSRGSTTTVCFFTDFGGILAVGFVAALEAKRGVAGWLVDATLDGRRSCREKNPDVVSSPALGEL